MIDRPTARIPGSSPSSGERGRAGGRDLGRGRPDHAARVRMARRGWAPPGRVTSGCDAAGTGLGAPSRGPFPWPNLTRSEEGELGLGLLDVRSEPVELGERAEALPDLTHLGLVVLDVLVGARRIPLAGELRVLVDRHADAAAGDIVRDLVAGLEDASRRGRQFVRRSDRPRARADPLTVGVEGLLERLRPGERAHVDAVGGEVIEPAVDNPPDLLVAAVEESADHFLDELPIERLDAARAERGTLETLPPALVQERIGFHLVAEHRRVPAVELELDSGR